MHQHEIAARLKALIDLDIAYARSIVPRMPDGTLMSDEGLLAGLHKTRLHVPAVPRHLRLESVEWLRAHGMVDLHGAPLPPPGQLPE